MPQKISNIIFPFDSCEYKNYHCDGNNTNYQKYVILTHARTGSNHLVSYLRSHDAIISFGELFQPDNVWFNYNDYPQHDSVKLIEYRNLYVEDFLDNMVYRKFAPHVSAVGFKIFYNQPGNIPGGGRIWKYLNALPDLKIIHLKRKNLLHAYASLVMAAKTDLWMVTKATHPSVITDINVYLSYDECLSFFRWAQNCIKEFKPFLDKKNELEIFYEDLVENSSETLDAIQAFLNLDRKNLYSECKKQHTKPISSYLVNYQELKSLFKKSEFEHFFEE